MSTGPITIFDKSMLQGLSLDEAVLFGQFYRCNLTPLFFVETLADLEKRVREGQTPEQVVGTIAAKTANLMLDPSVHHADLVIADLRGQRISMDGRVHVAGGRVVRQGDRQGVVFEQSQEMRAFNRWQKRQFLEIEREMARAWRENLQRQPLAKLPVTAIFGEQRPKDRREVKQWAEAVVRREGGPAFLFALNALEVPPQQRGPIFARWLKEGTPPISRFAPYAAFVLTIQVYFRLAVSLDLESHERASHSADIAYLFYLPFCMMFTSSDKLHARTVPLFLRRDQQFVLGSEMKADLRRLDEHFSAQPPEILERGVMYFEPPYEDDSYLATRLWKQFLPGWQPGRGERGEIQMSPESERALVAQFKEASEAPGAPASEVLRDPDDSDFLMVRRMVPVRMGKWRILPPEVEESEKPRQTAPRAEPRPAATEPPTSQQEVVVTPS